MLHIIMRAIYVLFGLSLRSTVPSSHPNDMVAIPQQWGSYRGNLYFGMRTRSPKSILTGLMWYSSKDNGQLNSKSMQY